MISTKFIKKNTGGIIGSGIIVILLIMAIYSIFFIPIQYRTQWNDPIYWSNNPRDAAPNWINLFLKPFDYQLPEYKVFSEKDAILNSISKPYFKQENYTFTYNFNSDGFPDAIDIPFSVKLGTIPPVIDIYVKRPDGHAFKIYSNALESLTNMDGSKVNSLSKTYGDVSSKDNLISGRIYSSSQEVKNSLNDYANLFNFSTSDISSVNMIFSKTTSNIPLKGTYKIIFSIYSFDNETVLKDFKIIVQGKVFGLLGTDEFRRDVFYGILIGTPVDLFIGIAVALTSTFFGLFYGLIAGYKGRKTETFMLLIIDIFLTLPSFILLIIISLHFGRNLFFLIGLFILFGWPGLALLNRTFSIQIKNYQYVQASKLMGESDLKIVLRHIVPQLLPFTLANFSLAVPVAILGESALSFLGLGDPAFPTWGQMLQDAHTYSAETLGYWWWIISPGFMISITSVAFILLGRFFEKYTKADTSR
ncbi:MAG TPA: ABC transporter permease [Verrucomicrobiae bacterium]|nr:ABC transporter permease [Verrucomicrobiae bacterium]